MIKKEKLKAGKPKNCADAVKDIANDTLNVTKEFVKIEKKQSRPFGAGIIFA